MRQSRCVNADAISSRPAVRCSEPNIVLVLGPLQPGFVVEVTANLADVTLGSWIFPLPREMPAHAAPNVPGSVVIAQVADPALVATPDAPTIIVDVERSALLR